MSNKAILDKLVSQADKLSLHLGRLADKDSVHEMDIDFLADRLKEMYSACLDLVTSDGSDEEISNINDLSSDNIEEIPAAGSVVGLPIADDTTPAEAQEDEPEEIREEIIQTEIKPDAKPPEIKAEDLNPGPENEEEDVEEELPAPKTTADLFSGTTTIADRYMKDEDKSIAARAVPQEVRDLKMAIGINDKFLFINELFKGDPAAYNKAIDELNGGNDHANAKTLLETYRSEFEWPENSEAYHRLKKIVYAKYPG
jgi:hypothetical protein